MSGTLDHTPADIVRELIIGLGLGGDPDVADVAWPVYSPNEPDLPDKMLAVTDTTGRQYSKEYDGKVREHPGIQIMVRAKTSPTGWVKANQVAVALDAVLNRNVTIDNSEYVVYSIERTGNILPLGKAVPESRRWMFSINAVVSLQKIN